MKNLLLLLTILLFNQPLKSQNNKLQHLRESLLSNKVYTPGKSYTYHAVKLNKDGDTLSSEFVKMNIPKELNMETEKEGKLRFVWEYPVSEETKDRLQKKSMAVVDKDWIQTDTTTMRFNESSLYLHPLRENQYYQVEVAGHPIIKFNNETYFSSKIAVIKGFGAYNMKMFVTTYELISTRTYRKATGEFFDCLHFNSETEVEPFSLSGTPASTSKGMFDHLPNSKGAFWVSGAYGFVQMNYEFYDGEKLTLKMIID